MKKPEIVPEHLSNSVNFYVLIGILIIGFGIFATLNILDTDNAGLLAFLISLSLIICLIIFAFIVSKQNDTGILSKSYFLLALGFSSYLIAELIYYSFDLILKIEAYPSIADIFFFAWYPFTFGYLLLNINYFHTGYTNFQKIWLPGIPVLALIVYVIISMNLAGFELNFDFYYGFIFVAGASSVLSFTMLGSLIFRQGLLGVIWLLLVIGLMINTAGDIWYYHLEIFGSYYDAHPVTVVWYVANMFIIYALYKHLKTI